MNFYHTNSDICFGKIIDVCDIENNNIDAKLKFSQFVRPEVATSSDLSFFTNPKYVTNTAAKFLITNKSVASILDPNKIILISNKINYDIAKISNLFYRSKTINEIKELPKYKIGSKSFISNNSIVNSGVSIGDNFSLGHFSSIDFSCSIGNNVKIGNNVTISNSIIGDNVCIGDGTKIGQDGFGFAYNDSNEAVKVFHIGRVIIQNGVNINANCTIDRGSFNDTIIGEHTFIDNLVHIAHNVTIGNNCMIAGQCGFAGSSRIGNFVQIGGQSGIGGHINIGDYVKIAAKSGIIRDINKGQVVMGYPAINMNKYLKNYKKLMMML
tara:strand:+ start:1384 stop:2358 length:975 start_codon:yes stop_codon:yes gene_type:complete